MQGSVTLVTGGASGLGRATAEHLVNLGGCVTICDLPSSKGEEVVEQLGKDKCQFIAANVTVENDIKNVINSIKKKYGRLDNVVNCAGKFWPEKVYKSKTNQCHGIESFIDVLNVNVTGTFNVIRLAAALINENKPNSDGQRGVIINVASIAAFEGSIGTVAYSASKGAIVGMTVPLARELADYGIRVCAIAPGAFYTNISKSARIPEALNRLSEQVVFPKRIGKPSEFAHLVQTIIENPMLNGEVIRLDAGLRLHAKL